MSFGHIVLADNKTNWFSKLIKLITRSEWSHSLVMVPPICGVDLAIEAKNTGVNGVAFDKAYRTNRKRGYKVFRVNIDPTVKEQAIAECLQELQTGYGFLELPWFAWRSISAFFGKDIRSQDNWSQAGIICSELCVMYLSKCGLDRLFEGFGKGSIHPEDLENIMLAHPAIFELIEVKE